MTGMNKSAPQRYLEELCIQLRQAGFTPQPLDENGLLPVEWQGHPLCRMTEDGGVRYRIEDVTGPELGAAKDRAVEITKTTDQYMRLLEQAPPLKARGLDGDYRLLSDFNDVVLAGHPTEYGVEFVTWEWSYDHTGVGTGHYFDNGCKGYNAAERDFAVRSGLVQENRLFSTEQLVEIFRCVCETLENEHGYPMTAEREKLLKGIADQIERGVPDLDRLAEEYGKCSIQEHGHFEHDANLDVYMDKIEFDESVYSKESGSITLYYIAPAEMLNGKYPGAESMEIMIEFPVGHPEPDYAQVMFSPTQDGSDYDWFGAELADDDIRALIAKCPQEQLDLSDSEQSVTGQGMMTIGGI